jgi:hypothetical protein
MKFEIFALLLFVMSSPNFSSQCRDPVLPVCVVFPVAPDHQDQMELKVLPVPKDAVVNLVFPVTKVLLVLLVLRELLENVVKRDHLVCLSVVNLV